MIRGVNRQIIEVNDTENRYFERAILFVRSDCGEATEHKLHSQAVDWLATASPTTLKAAKRKQYFVSRKALWLMLIATAASAIGMALLHFLG